MSARWNDPEWDPNPYEAKWASSEPPGAKSLRSPDHKEALSVTHDLTDDELRRFVNFDVFYDPMPFLGRIPQWAVFVLFAAMFGALGGLTVPRKSTITTVVIGAVMCPVLILGLFDLATAVSRHHARAIGLCDGRTVTVSATGLSVQIPASKRTSMPGIGPLVLSWSGIRKISTSERDLMFWMRPSCPDLEGRLRVVVPLRAFASNAEAVAFETAAQRWHAIAVGEDAHWRDEGPT